MMEKIAFVCQRYGLEVNGGSELYCRQVAERLAEYYEVTVYTTCALDYTTWANHYPAGEETINGVRVKRWPVRKERKQERFDRISAKVSRLTSTRPAATAVRRVGSFSPTSTMLI